MSKRLEELDLEINDKDADSPIVYPYPTSLRAFFIVCASLVLSMGVTIYFIVKSGKAVVVLLAQALFSILLIVIPWIFIKTKNYRKDVFRLQKGKAKKMVYLFVVLINLSIILFFSGMIINSYDPKDLNSYNSSTTKRLTSIGIGILVFFSVALCPCIFEEILFRGFFQKSVEYRTKKQRLSTIIIGFIFSLAHFDFTVFGFFYKWILGIIFGQYAARTDSIFPGMLGHFINNSIAIILQNYLHDLNEIFTGPSAIIMSLVCLIISIISYIIFVKKFKYREFWLHDTNSDDDLDSSSAEFYL
ncbi:caax amino terminal protease [Anaeramoeba flamelloides]|uniref:Caax amino terminal protease n=1 Tax=Anaeramoeba flamelloides TaxID=1746091 RepID=A0AAV8AA22_9EUKA|nr:caax amino terminal protease [Anaeramoeba flamelloides]